MLHITELNSLYLIHGGDSSAPLSIATYVGHDEDSHTYLYEISTPKQTHIVGLSDDQHKIEGILTSSSFFGAQIDCALDTSDSWSYALNQYKMLIGFGVAVGIFSAIS
ncbi:MAG: hypothetical protein FJ161_01030 [Gammaproteobacteria bacterium]|nr:hypothetical protein [Gammaproteobacteria bacterium]